MNTSNLEKLGRKMAAAERRISVSYLVGQANSKMIPDEMDDLRIGHFERTGCMITRNVDNQMRRSSRRGYSFLSKYQRKHFLLIQIFERR